MQIEHQGRQILKAFSIPTSDFGRFIPLGEVDDAHPTAGWHYRNFKAAIEANNVAFMAIPEEMIGRWDELVTRTIGYWADVASTVYGNLLGAGRLPTRGQLGMDPISEDDDNPYETPSETEWVGWFITNKVRPRMLSRDEAAARFTCKWKVRPIVPPQALLKAQAEAALDSAELELRRDFLQGAKGAVDEFYRDIVAELRSRLFNALTDALEGMQRNGGKIPGRSQTGLKNLIEYVDNVKVWPDRDLEAQLAEMRGILALSPDVREVTSDEIAATFRRIAAEAKLTLIELDRDQLRSGRDLGIPDDEGKLEVLAERGRRKLDLGGLDDNVADIQAPRRGRRAGSLA
jgi:hypothetical protein